MMKTLPRFISKSKILVLLFTIFTLNAYTQCVPTVSNFGATGDYINDFTFGTLSNLNSGDNPNDYALYTQTGNYIQGLSYAFSVTIGTPFGQGVGIWIDYNGNNLFTDPGEFVFASSSVIASTASATGTITIPLTATPGTRRMRVVAKYASLVLASESCGITSWGEYEDYNITIVANTPCSGTPTAGVAVASPANPCPGANVSLTLNGASLLGGLGYQWFRSTTATGPWIPLPGGNTPAYSFVASVPYYYRCIVTCLNSGQYDSSASVFVQVQPWSPTSSCYCTSNATTTADEEILNVTIGALNNTTDCVTPLVGSQGTGTGLGTQFADFTGSTVPVPLLYQGLAAPFSLTVGTCGTFNYTNAFKVYIDYNHNANFTDPGEEVYFSGTAGLSCLPATTVNGSINVPISALTGITRMRVINQEGGQSTATTIVPCGTYGYGETEDYLVNIIAPTPQDPAVSAITGPSGNCFTANETINVTVKNYGSQNINCLLNPVTVYLYDNNIFIGSQTLPGSTLSAYGNSSLTATFNNVNLYAGGSHCLNTTLTIGSAGGVVNGNLWNDSLANAYCLLNYRPTAGPDFGICQNVPIPFGQGLTVSGCATPINDSVVLTFSLTSGQPPMCVPTATNPQGSCLFASASLPILPAGASFTANAKLVITNLYTSPTCLGCVYASEQRFSIFSGSAPPIASNIIVPGTQSNPNPGNSIPTGYTYRNPNITPTQLGNMYNAVGPGGVINLGNWNVYSSNTSVANSMNCNYNGNPTIATLTIYYQYVPASFEWYNVPTNGSVLYTLAPFDPTSVTGSGLPNTNTPGTTTFYAACSGSSNCRVPVDLVINPSPLAYQDTLALCESPVGSNGAEFNLTTMNGFVSGFVTPTIVEYFGDQGLFSQILNDTAYLTSTNFVYAKVSDSLTGCYSSDSLLLKVNTTPAFGAGLLSGFACAPACIDVASLINPFATVPFGTDTLYYEDNTYTTPHPNPHCVGTVDTVYMVFQTNSIPSCNDTAIAIVNVQGGTNEIASQIVPGNYSQCGSVGSNIFSLTDGNADTLRTSTDCKKVVAIYDVPNGTDLGSITVNEDIDCTFPLLHNGQPYVNRNYQITPTNNDSAMVCLYFLDDDFAYYNNAAFPNWPLLPTGANQSLTTNLCITKVDNGDLNTPGHTAIAIPNSQISSSYDPNTTVWTVCFPVSSFSYFYCHSCNPSNTPLPVILTDFKGRRVNETSVLTWTTKTEINNSHFVVERSRDARSFTALSTSIPTKALNGTSSSELNYAYTDNTPMQGHNYYRLAQYDIDGKQSLSDVVDVYFGDETMVTMYPNPVNTELSIDINTPKATNASVKILDATGRVVRSLELQLSTGMNHSQVDLNGLADGIYMVKVSNGKGLNYSQTVRKN